MTKRFSGKTALITGASSGIGAATAELLATEGAARLVLVDRAEPPNLSATEAEIVTLRGDVCDEAFWSGAEQRLAGIDLAVVNAGIASAGPIAELDFADWRRTLSVNLDGAFLTLRAALRAMQTRGEPGAIVCTASIAGLKAEPGTAAYGSSKAAVIQLARVAAKESAAAGIRVNAIAPGGVDTPIWDEMPFFRELVAEQGGRPAAIAAMARMATPLGRYANAGEIARQIAFLLSDDAATITGAVLTSDGGYSL